MVFVEDSGKDDSAAAISSANGATSAFPVQDRQQQTRQPSATNRSNTANMALSSTDSKVPETKRAQTDHHISTAFGNTSSNAVPTSPASPFAAASAISEHSQASPQSYAHRRSVSGWEKLFTNMSQRSATHEHENTNGISDHADLERRVPGIGEDSLTHGDVQSDDNLGNGRDAFAHKASRQMPNINGSYSQPTTPFAAIANRDRSNTGASSTGSALQYDHGPTTSTTALSPTYRLPSTDDQHESSSITNLKGKHTRLLSTDAETGSHHHDFHGHHFPQIYHHKSNTSIGNRQERSDSELHQGPSALWSRLFIQSGEAGVQADGGAYSGDDAEDEGVISGEDNAIKHKRMEDLRNKFKRAVVIASAITRKHPRTMKSAGLQGVFPFLQDAMFVPMFYFMRDEHGHRAPPVIFDAIRLNIVVGGPALSAEEDQHSFARIELQYGDVKWVIHRRINDFLSLHTMLTLRKFKGRVNQVPPFPPQLSYALEKARAFKPGHSHHQSSRMQQANIDRKQALENYLLKLLRALNMRPSYEVCTFLELSAVSIMKDVGWKGKEGNLDRRVEHTTGMWCTPHDLRRWSRQWVLVRDSYIAFCNHISDPYPSDVLFADPQFDIKFRKKTGRNPLFPYRITISNEYRRIQLRSDSERTINEWRHSITEMKNSSAWAQPHRFASFAPVRENSRVIWFVDGDDYFYALSEALENATDCIYIEDWWLSPELHLRRPYALNEEYRIDRLLKRKAEEGIKIYVVVYKEVTVSLTINSAYTKRKLQSLHPNIMVQRHPDHLAGGTMFWAHHEKMVIVDNTFAFIGGLDLCWGRYDTHGHRLSDYYLPYKGKPFSHLQIFFGQDYNNARIHDFTNVNDYEETLIDRRTTSRMPWHDVHMAMIGQPARDVARHFIQRWNFIKSSKGMAKTHMPFLMPKGEYSASRNDLQYHGSCRTQALRSSAEWSLGITKESSIHTAYCEMIRNAKHFIYIENQFFISNAKEDAGYTVKNRVAEALVDRIKRAHKRQEKFRVFVLIPLMPAFEGDVSSVGAATLKLVMHWQYQSICRGEHSIACQLDKEGINMHDYIRFFGLRTYDVIRRYADGGVKQDVSVIAGNAPQEAPGFEKELKQQGVPAIERDPKITDLKKGRQQNESKVGPPRLSPEDESVRAATIANHSIHHGGVPPATSLSFKSPEQSSIATGEYSFQRPDEAFVENNVPMKDNPTRISQEMTRRSHDHGIAGSISSRQQAQHNLPGRRSFNLPRKTLSRQRSSFSGLRGFFTGDRESRHTKDTAAAPRRNSSSLSSSPSSSPSASDNDSDGDYSYDNVHDKGPRTGYPRRVDKEGQRRNAFRYLLRGTEHLKQYGRQRMPGRHMKGGGPGHKLHKRLHKYGMAGLERRDSDSEFAGSSMHVDMDDVDNYVHPPRYEGRNPEDAAFLGDQQEGRAVERMQPTVLPDFAGTEYVRERQLVDADATGFVGTTAGAEPATDKAPAGLSASTRRNTKRASDIGSSSNTAGYPPPPRPGGPQVLEHEVFSKRKAPEAEHLAQSKKQAPGTRPPPLTTHRSAQAALGTIEAHPKTGGAASEIVHVEPEVIDQVVTELVYIHCKLMIVDDRYVVMGSANINDRSMVGNRDSEIAMIIEDSQPVVTTMNGRPYQAAKFAHSLRVQLCQEHCGLLGDFDQMRYVYEMYGGKPPINTQRSEAENQDAERARKLVEDPLSEGFQEMWWSVATKNEELFRDVFRCVPDDTVETFDQYKKFIPGHEVPHGHALPTRTTAETLELLKGVKGHLVPIPLNFLKSENLGAKLGDKEMLVPVEVFT